VTASAPASPYILQYSIFGQLKSWNKRCTMHLHSDGSANNSSAHSKHFFFPNQIGGFGAVLRASQSRARVKVVSEPLRHQGKGGGLGGLQTSSCPMADLIRGSAAGKTARPDGRPGAGSSWLGCCKVVRQVQKGCISNSTLRITGLHVHAGSRGILRPAGSSTRTKLDRFVVGAFAGQGKAVSAAAGLPRMP
jgi:hypothetical protein